MSNKEDEKVEEEVTEEVAPEPEEYSDPEMQKAKEERDAAIAAVRERQVFLAEQYCKPHTKVSRFVKEEDLDRVIHEGKLMHEMCLVGRGEYNTAYAIAHSQLNSEDPLRFFVTYEGQFYINPVIEKKGHELYQANEGCMSYPEEPMKGVVRYKKVKVKFRTIGHKQDPETGEDLGEYYLTKQIEQEVDGQFAQILQHECQHLNGSDIYREGSSSNESFGVGKAGIILTS